MDKFVAQEAEVIIGKIKDNTPTRTGRLKNGWKHSRAIQGKTTIYNNVKYAAHVEYGHRQTPGAVCAGHREAAEERLRPRQEDDA